MSETEPAVTAVLTIGHWSSSCGSCGRGADPKEERHTTQLGYGDHLPEGCGALFTAVTAEYTGEDEAIGAMRPDLRLIPSGPLSRGRPPERDSDRSSTCGRYFGSDGTLCSTHNGRLASPSEMRCDRALAGVPLTNVVCPKCGLGSNTVGGHICYGPVIEAEARPHPHEESPDMQRHGTMSDEQKEKISATKRARQNKPGINLGAFAEWQVIASTLSDALIAAGGHARERHQAPQSYDSMSGLACTAPGCVKALRASGAALLATYGLILVETPDGPNGLRLVDPYEIGR